MYSLPLLTGALRSGPDRGSGTISDPVGRAHVRAVSVEGRDGEAVHRLAAISGGKSPTGAVLLAEVAGDPVAAIGIFDGNVIIDPGRSDLSLRVRMHVDRLFALAVIAFIGV